MIVRRQEAKRIYEGRKEQHRLRLYRKPPPVEAIVPITYREPNEALGYTRAGTPREEATLLCHVRITESWPTRVLTASPEDLEAEGYPDFDAFHADWPDLSERVWVLRFYLEPMHRPRLLSGRIIAGHQGDYVSSRARALPDEPEAIDPITQQEYADEANARDLARFAAQRNVRDQLPFELRLRELRAEARRRHIDIRDELRAIKRWRDPAARERQLERIRCKVDGPVSPIAA